MNSIENIGKSLLAPGPLQQPAPDAKLGQAAGQFEAVLLTEVFKSLMETAHLWEDEGEGSQAGGAAAYEEMLPESMAQAMQSAGGLGLASWLRGQVDGPEASAQGELRGLERGGYAAGSCAAPALRAGGRGGLETALVWPVEGQLSSPFGDVRHRQDGSLHVHQGIDLAAPSGTPIRAAAAGRVSYSGWRQGYGETIEIQHPDGTWTRYGHCSRRLPEAGTWVEQGQWIGDVGSTGNSTGPHLHFEVLQGNQALDPLHILRQMRAEGGQGV